LVNDLTSKKSTMLKIITATFALLIFQHIQALPYERNNVATDNVLNDRPVIAVLAQQASAFPGYSYIAASYVKYLESVGARVVPIPESFSEDEVRTIFKHVNGVLYPGGSTDWFTSKYYKNAKLAYETSINSTLSGEDYFPIWGTCLGYETLNVITSGTNDVLSHFDAEDITIPLNYTDEARSSRLFKDAPMSLYKAMGTQDLTYNHHSFGVSPDTHKTNRKINGFFKLLTTSLDSYGKEFVSSIEAYDFPIYGTQWHPEKNNFEFHPDLHVAHNKAGVDTSLYMASFFVNEARKNKQRFPSREMEENYMIYQYNTKHTGVGDSKLKLFEQIYLFEN